MTPAWIVVVAGEAWAAPVINEVLTNPSGKDDGQEWVEIYNPGPGAVDLSGWKVEAGTSTYGVKYTFAAGASVAAGDWVVVGESGVAGADFALAAGKLLGLGNASSSCDAVRLVNSGGGVVDTVVYGSTNSDGWLDDGGAAATSFPPAPSEGSSLARAADGIDTNASGADFTAAPTPTPGAANVSSCDDGDGLVINEVLPNPAGADGDAEWVEIFNDSAAAIDLSSFSIAFGTSSFSKRVKFPAGTTLAPGGFLVVGGALAADADVVVTGLDLGNASSNADAVRIEDCNGDSVDTLVYGASNPDNWQDDAGAVATSFGAVPLDGQSIARKEDGVDTDVCGADFALQLYPTPGASNAASSGSCGGPGSAVVLNELMIDPVGSDNGAEWVELYGAGVATVDLSGWSIATATTATKWTVTDAIPRGVTLAPGARLLLAGKGYTGTSDLVIADLALPNGTDGDGVRLQDCRGFVADTVVYGGTNTDAVPDDSGAAATSLAPDPPEGQSLQRLLDGLDSDECGEDFAVQGTPTPGAPNVEIDLTPCAASAGGLVINEVLYDPEGDDAGAEWVEFFNPTDAPALLSGWTLWGQASPDDAPTLVFTIPDGTSVARGGFLVVGGAAAEDADVVESFTLSNGGGGDLLQLRDCEGGRVDTVVYGESTLGGFEGDAGEVDAFGAPPEGASLARAADGEDATQGPDDWVADGTPTPGFSNETADSRGIGDSGLPGGGCGSDDPEGGCATAKPTWIGALAVLLLRRRRRAG